VHPKFDTGAAENLWRTACGPRAALRPPLEYKNKGKTKPRERI